MSVHALLRAATRAAHDRVDALFSGFDLAAPAGYRGFLTAQARAFLPLERALDVAGAAELFPDWAQRRRADLLRADLAALDLAVPALLDPPPLASTGALAGAAYVLEGSRLGGAMLARLVPAGVPSRFLAAPAAPGQWRGFLARLEALLGHAAERDEAVRGAHAAFESFALAASEATAVQ